MHLALNSAHFFATILTFLLQSLNKLSPSIFSLLLFCDAAKHVRHISVLVSRIMFVACCQFAGKLFLSKTFNLLDEILKKIEIGKNITTA